MHMLFLRKCFIMNATERELLLTPRHVILMMISSKQMSTLNGTVLTQLRHPYGNVL